jgi:hypothetical protein
LATTNFASVADTDGKFATDVNDTMVAICHWYQRHRQQICHR